MREAGRARAAARVAAGLALAWVLGACAMFSRATRDYSPRPGPYDRRAGIEDGELRLLRQLRDSGEFASARAFLARLCPREPANLMLARMQQDVELALAAPEARGEFAQRARQRAAQERSVPALLLAARVEPDADEARDLFERAAGLDAASAWTQYAMAHFEALQGHWAQASQRLERALEIDPGHALARRLEGMLLARAGRREEAVDSLRRWIETHADDPLFTQQELDEARLDLAQVYLLDEEPGLAARELRALSLRAQVAHRYHEVLAAVEQAQGEPRRALASARRAAALDSSQSLPALQVALLQSDWLGDPREARKAWARVLELAEARRDLAALLLALRARAALERLDAAAGARDADARRPEVRSARP